MIEAWRRLAAFAVLVVGIGSFDAARAAELTCVAPPSGLVGWWTADGYPNDIASGNDGTLVGNTTYAAGQVGHAFSLDGTNGTGVSLGNPAALRLQDFTIDAWVKRASAVTVGNGPFGEGAILVYGHNGYGFGILSDGQLFITKVDVDHADSGASLKVTDTNYHHVAVTKSGTSVVFYIDGTASSPVVYSSVFAFTKDAAIGARLDVSQGTTALTATFSGSIDELEFFNRALSASEVQAIAAAGSAGKCKPNLDVDGDGDGEVQPLSDGLLILRHRFGFTGAVLVTGAVDLANCTRCEADPIEAYLALLDIQLDVDDSGSTGPLTDALLILRWMFGFTGDTLISGAVDTGGCERCTAEAITAYLLSIGGG